MYVADVDDLDELQWLLANAEDEVRDGNELAEHDVEDIQARISEVKHQLKLSQVGGVLGVE